MISRLVTLQKRAIRVINKSNFDAHSDPIYKELSIFKHHNIFLLQLGQFMYSYKKSSLPSRFSNKTLRNNQFHAYNTRSSHALHLPYCRTNAEQFSLFFRTLKFYNSLKRQLIKTNWIFTFKLTLKYQKIKNYE